MRFVELAATPTAAASSVISHLELTIGGRYTVRLGGDFDAAALQRLLDVVERRT